MSSVDGSRRGGEVGGARGRTLGSPRVHLRVTDSTNERVRALALAGAPDGTLVTASEQTAGRGRHERRWIAPPGSSLLMSLLVREPSALLPLSSAVAVCDAVGGQARIKWPNDIVLVTGGRLAKLAGILIEARPQHGWAVVGIGVNVAVRLEELEPELAADAADSAAGDSRGRSALPAATLGLPASEVEALLGRVLEALAVRVEEPADATIEAWSARDALFGREIAWAGGRGQAQGIDGTGRLVVALPAGGSTTLGAGEVHLQEVSA